MKLRVLIVEDDPSTVKQIENKILIELGNSSVFESTPEWRVAPGLTDDLCEWIDKEIFHLVIIDYALSSGDGFKVLERLSNRDILRRAKAIVYTAKLDDAHDILKALKLGAFSFVRKGKQGSQRYPTTFRQEVKRALEAVVGDVYTEMLGGLVDNDIQQFFLNKYVTDELRRGCVVRKAILLSDLARSTPFLRWVVGQTAGHQWIGQVLGELLGWQAKIVKEFGGVVDKFYGDEVRAYFGTDVHDDDVDAEDLCNKALGAAYKISKDFPQKLEQIFEKIMNTDKRPNEFPYPRIIVNFSPVRWAMYGSNSHRDLTVWTENVALLNRMLSRARQNPRKVRQIKDAFGEIYLTENVNKNKSINGIETTLLDHWYFDDLDLGCDIHTIQTEPIACITV